MLDLGGRQALREVAQRQDDTKSRTFAATIDELMRFHRRNIYDVVLAHFAHLVTDDRGPRPRNAPLWSTTPSSVPRRAARRDHVLGVEAVGLPSSRHRRGAGRAWRRDRASAGRDDASTGPARLTLF